VMNSMSASGKEKETEEVQKLDNPWCAGGV
jgi:hypothetical protein